MTPSYCVKKNSIRYRYYTCSSKHRLTSEKCVIRTISAAEVEGLATEQVLKLLAKPEVIAHAISANSTIGELQDLQVVNGLQDIQKYGMNYFQLNRLG